MMLQAASALLVRDLRLTWRRRGEALQPVLFAVLVVILFALGSDGPQALARNAPTVLWLAALFSSLMGLDSLFRTDAEDGTLEQWLTSAQPLAVLVAARIAGHWVATALPLLVAMPLLAQLVRLPSQMLAPLMVSLILGTPLLSLIGAVVAALAVGVRRSGGLLALLTLPLFVPVLVFGAGSVLAAAQGLDAGGAWLLLAAALVIASVCAPLSAAAALRIGLR